MPVTARIAAAQVLAGCGASTAAAPRLALVANVKCFCIFSTEVQHIFTLSCAVISGQCCLAQPSPIAMLTLVHAPSFIILEAFMSKFVFLLQQLDAYEAMEQHHNTLLAQRFMQVQQWQKNRVRKTHQLLFAEPKHQPIVQYFLSRLYGVSDFKQLAYQLRRIANHAHVVERVIPANALKTGELAVQLAHLSLKLDEEVASYLLQNYAANHPLNDDIMRQAYLECNQYAARYEQMRLLDQLGEKLDLYLRSRLIKTAFKLSKGMAYRYKVDPIYEFINEGFTAMEPLNSAQRFIQAFTQKERQIIDAVQYGHPQPFQS
jgi:hypothetical protein